MRVAQVVRRFAFEEWGGTENVVWNTALKLREFGVDSEIFCTRACSSAGDEVRNDIPIRRFDYRYPYWPLSAEKILALDKKGGNPVSFPMLRALRSGRFDLYHAHALARTAAMTREAARANRKPYVISLHGGCFDVPRSELVKMTSPLTHTLRWGGVLDRLRGWKRDVLADADGILCVGANELDELRRRYPGKPVEYLPNAVDPAVFRRPTPYRLRETLGIPPDRAILLCVSRLDYQKNQRLLLELTARLRAARESVHLLLIGPPSAPDYVRELENRAREPDLAGFVTIVPGAEPGGDLIRAAYAAADVFILPSVHEPFGIVALEAWSAGVPVIGSAVGGLRHLLTDGETGLLFPSDNLDALETAWRRLREPALRETLIQGGIRAVEAYAPETIVGRLVRFYEEVLR